MKTAKVTTALLLAVVLIAGCVNIASLITLGTQIAVDIIQVIAAFQGRADAADISEAQAVGAEAQKDWALLAAAYATYESNKSVSNLQNVVNAASVLENNLASLLAASHIKNAELTGRVEAAAATLFTLVDTIAADLGATIPVSPATAQLKARRTSIIVGPVKSQVRAIRELWNNTAAQGIAGAQL